MKVLVMGLTAVLGLFVAASAVVASPLRGGIECAKKLKGSEVVVYRVSLTCSWSGGPSFQVEDNRNGVKFDSNELKLDPFYSHRSCGNVVDLPESVSVAVGDKDQQVSLWSRRIKGQALGNYPVYMSYDNKIDYGLQVAKVQEIDELQVTFEQSGKLPLTLAFDYQAECSLMRSF